MKERRHGPNQNFERAKDFKGTLKKLFNFVHIHLYLVL